MNPKLPLNGHIYMLTVCRVLSTKVVSGQSRSAFVQSHFQSQAMLTFVTAYQTDNFDCTKINAYFSLPMGGTSRVEAYIVVL